MADQPSMSPEEQLLVTENIKLAHFIKNKFLINGGHSQTDIESACLFALVKAAKTFDANKGIKFATYAAKCMNNEVLMYLRKNKNIPRETCSLDFVINGDDEGRELVLFDVLGKEDEYHFIEKEIARNCLNSIDGVERKVIDLIYGENKTQKEVANHLGLSQSYVSRIQKRALKRMREKYYLKENRLNEKAKI